MAHESFEDSAVADILNVGFISIKVDKEERPDVDSVYMDVCQAFTGSGGWPTSIFMAYDKQPFYAGTYYPKERFKQLLQQISMLWAGNRPALKEQATRIIAAIQSEKREREQADLECVEEDALQILTNLYEPEYGGFSDAPKFPTPHYMLFLMEQYEKKKDPMLLQMCERTLSAMRDGGIYDHVGGGFSRYSTDRKWLVPHFEKMLYDNALLCIAYSKLYEITKTEAYARTVRETAGYLMRDLMHPDGAFFTAEDADSGGGEGEFYLFTREEVESVLGRDAEAFIRYYPIDRRGNFEGKTILNTIGMEIPEDVRPFLKACLDALFLYRNSRVRPHRDEKILTGQNGLAIAAFAIAGRILQDKAYVKTAENAVHFLFANVSSADGSLTAVFNNGKGKTPAFAEDYANLIWGLLELYRTTGAAGFLSKAEMLQGILQQHFFDAEHGGYYQVSKTAEKMIVEKKEMYDGAVPSGNSVAMQNLLDLYLFTHNTDYIRQLSKTLRTVSPDLAAHPHAYIHSIALVSRLKAALPQITVCDSGTCRPAPKTLAAFMRE